MKKTLTTIALMIISIIAFSQAKTTGSVDTAAKRDSVQYVPVYIIDITDTVKQETILYRGENNLVKFSSPGWYIRKGKATKNEKGQMQYVEQPVIIGALDSGRRPVKPI